MSVVRSLRYSCPPSGSITLEDLKNFLYDATVLDSEDGLVPHVTIKGGSDTSKVGTIRSIVIEGVIEGVMD